MAHLLAWSGLQGLKNNSYDPLELNSWAISQAPEFANLQLKLLLLPLLGRFFLLLVSPESIPLAQVYSLMLDSYPLRTWNLCGSCCHRLFQILLILFILKPLFFIVFILFLLDCLSEILSRLIFVLFDSPRSLLIFHLFSIYLRQILFHLLLIHLVWIDSL